MGNVMYLVVILLLVAWMLSACTSASTQWKHQQASEHCALQAEDAGNDEALSHFIYTECMERELN